jgi:hypothetical protein
VLESRRSPGQHAHREAQSTCTSILKCCPKRRAILAQRRAELVGNALSIHTASCCARASTAMACTSSESAGRGRCGARSVLRMLANNSASTRSDPRAPHYVVRSSARQPGGRWRRFADRCAEDTPRGDPAESQWRPGWARLGDRNRHRWCRVPARGRSVYDMFHARNKGVKRRRGFAPLVVASLGVRDSEHELEPAEVAGALAAQIQSVTDEPYGPRSSERSHRSFRPTATASARRRAAGCMTDRALD